MIHLEFQPEIEAQLAAEARARGLALDLYIEPIITARPHDAVSTASPAETVAALREGRKGIRLDGLKIKDLIEEGRKY